MKSHDGQLIVTLAIEQWNQRWLSRRIVFVSLSDGYVVIFLYGPASEALCTRQWNGVLAIGPRILKPYPLMESAAGPVTQPVRPDQPQVAV